MPVPGLRLGNALVWKLQLPLCPACPPFPHPQYPSKATRAAEGGQVAADIHVMGGSWSLRVFSFPSRSLGTRDFIFANHLSRIVGMDDASLPIIFRGGGVALSQKHYEHIGRLLAQPKDAFAQFFKDFQAPRANEPPLQQALLR